MERELKYLFISYFVRDTCITVAHVSNRLKFNTFFWLSYFLLKMISVIDELYCHKKNCHLFRRCSTELLVLSKVFLKVSRISLESTCARLILIVKAWLYPWSVHLHYKTDSCTQLLSNEFCRIFKNTFLLDTPGRVLLTLYLACLNQTSTWSQFSINRFLPKEVKKAKKLSCSKSRKS